MAIRHARLAHVPFRPLTMMSRRLTGKALADAVGALTGQAFADTERLQKALTHASARSGVGTDYERLEFLGDRVLGLVVAEMVFEAHPGAPEGELSIRLNALVNAETLATIAEETGLAEFIKAGRQLRGISGAKRVNIRADVMEALIAAIYLEGGLDAARIFIHRFWKPHATVTGGPRRDAKTELQEWAHRTSGLTPSYETLSRIGPDHDPVFTVAVRIGDLIGGEGTGRSKREAEQAAARDVLTREGVLESPDT
jgi:ribonuclease-3